jgi:hypothetical protein
MRKLDLDHDVVALMLARRQIDKRSYKAARQYQHLRQQSGTDPTANKTLRTVEAALVREYGGEGLTLLRAVLAGSTIAAVAAAMGDTTKAAVEFIGGWFRRLLDTLVAIFATPVAA